MTTPARSSAALIKSMVGDTSGRMGAAPTPSSLSSASPRTGGATGVSSISYLVRDPAPVASASAVLDDDRRDFVHSLLELETSKNREIDHLRIRLGQLTKRNAELEASMTVMQKALEEEAAAGLGARRSCAAAVSRAAWCRWRERLARRRFERVMGAADEHVRVLKQSISFAPQDSVVDSTTHLQTRKAMEELAWAERQWAEDRLSYVQRSLDAFRFGSTTGINSSSPSRDPETAARSSALSDASLTQLAQAAKHLADRSNAVATARLQLLHSTFQSYGGFEDMKSTVGTAVLRLEERLASARLHTPAAEDGDVGEVGVLGSGPIQAPSYSAPPTVPSTAPSLMRAALADVAQDAYHSLVTVLVGPPAMHLLRHAVCASPGGMTSVLDVLDEILMRQPLVQQVRHHIKEFLSSHMRLEKGVQQQHLGVPTLTAPASSIRPEPVMATFFLTRPPEPLVGTVDHPLTAAETIRRHVYSASSAPLNSHVIATPRQHPLRWDLVHSILSRDDDAPDAATSHSTVTRIAEVARESGGSSVSRLQNTRKLLERVKQTGLI